MKIGLTAYKYLPYAIIALIAVMYFAGNVLWYQRQSNHYIMDRDEALHFIDSIRLFTEFDDKRNDLSILKHYSSTLIPALITSGMTVFGRSDIVKNYALYINSLYLVIALLFVFKIGEILAGRHAGIMAVLLLAAYPVTAGVSRLYGNGDLPALSVMTVNIFCLLKSSKFKDLKWSLIYAASVILGLITRNNIVAFLIGPFLFSAAYALFVEKNMRSARNIALVVVLAVPFYVYLHGTTDMLYKLLSESGGEWYKINNLRIYTIGLSEELLSPPLFAVFVWGLYGFIKKYGDNYAKGVILSWFAIPWLMLVLMMHRKIAIYGLPYLPAIALISAIGLSQLVIPYRKLLYAFLAIVSAIQYFDFSYGLGPRLYDVTITLGNQTAISYFKLNTTTIFQADERGKYYEVLVASMRKHAVDAQAKMKNTLVTIDKNYWGIIDPAVLSVIAWQIGMPLTIPTDSIYFTNKPIEYDKYDAVVCFGEKPFATKGYFENQYHWAEDIALFHPLIKEEIMRMMNEADMMKIEASLKTLRNRLKNEIVIELGKLDGILYME